MSAALQQMAERQFAQGLEVGSRLSSAESQTALERARLAEFHNSQLQDALHSAEGHVSQLASRKEGLKAQVQQQLDQLQQLRQQTQQRRREQLRLVALHCEYLREAAKAIGSPSSPIAAYDPDQLPNHWPLME